MLSMRERADDIKALAYLCQQNKKKKKEEYDKEKMCRGQKHRRRVSRSGFRISSG